MKPVFLFLFYNKKIKNKLLNINIFKYQYKCIREYSRAAAEL